MPNLTDILGGSVVDGVAKIIGLFKVDPTVALEKKVELDKIQLQMQSSAAKALTTEVQRQIDVNLAEAQNKSVFVAGWRPAVGWVCAGAFAYTYIVQPFLTFGLLLFHQAPLVAQVPKVDMSGMMPVLLGMLGLGALRSYDKAQGTGNGH